MDAPTWLRSLMNPMSELHFITEKVITASDVSADQNRLLIPKMDAEANLVPYLTAEERNRTFPPGFILHGGRLVGRRSGRLGDASAGAAAPIAPRPVLQGIPVDVYQRSKWMFRVQLKFWPSSSEVVLNGCEYGLLISWNNILKAGDAVQLWSFRPDGIHLCFVIFKV